VAGDVFETAQDPPVQAEASHGPGVGAPDVTLLGQAVVVNHGNVCCLLTESLQHVSFAVLVLRNVASYCFVPNS
jgi:hypothetical protein